MIDPLVARLAERRRKAGLSQRAVAAALGYDHSLLCLVERGRRQPSLAMLRAYAELLDAPLDLVEMDEDGDAERDPQIPGQLRTAAQRRERVLGLAAKGKHIDEIAAEVGCAGRTVHRHLASARAGARRRDAA